MKGNTNIGIDSIQDAEKATQIVPGEHGGNCLLVPAERMPDGVALKSQEFKGALPPEHKRQWVETVVAEYNRRLNARQEEMVAKKLARMEKEQNPGAYENTSPGGIVLPVGPAEETDPLESAMAQLQAAESKAVYHWEEYQKYDRQRKKWAKVCDTLREDPDEGS